MAKQGMKRPEITDSSKKNDAVKVPLIQGKAKSGKVKAAPIIAGTGGVDMKVWHTKPYSDSKERPISDIYPVIDNDLARDNVENDLTSADIQEL